jgi:flagellin-like hook-associated protein FlgL
MITGASLTMSYNHISSFYKQNENALGQALLHLASGKRVGQPSDNIPDFFYAAKLKQTETTHERIRSELNEALSKTDIAETAGTYVFEDLSAASQLVKTYYDTGTPQNEKDSIKLEFSKLLKQVSSVVDNTYIDQKQVISTTGSTPFAKASIDTSDPNEFIELHFTNSQVPDVTGLTLGTTDYATESDALQSELNKAASYLSKVSVFKRSVNAFININEKGMQSNQTTYRGITSSDTGMEMLNVMNRSIKHESTLSMMAQANLSRASVLKLFS